MVAPALVLADYIIYVMFHEIRVNIKNVGLHKKCLLALPNAVAPAASLGGHSRTSPQQAKQLRRLLLTLNAGQGSHIRVRLKTYGVLSRRPASSL